MSCGCTKFDAAGIAGVNATHLSRAFAKHNHPSELWQESTLLTYVHSISILSTYYVRRHFPRDEIQV